MDGGGEETPENDDEGSGGWWDSINGLGGLSELVSGWIGSALEGLSAPFGWIANGLTSLGKAMGNGFDSMTDYMGQFLTNLIQGFKDMGKEISGIGSMVGGWFVDLGKDLGDFFAGVGKGIADFSKSVGGWFVDLGKDIGEFFAGLGKGIADFSKSVGGWFVDLFSKIGDIFKSLGEVLDYINPFSKKFFLYIAVIPSDGYFTGFANEVKNTISEPFAFVNQFKDAMKAVTATMTSSEWKGIKATIPLIDKEVTVISPTFVNYSSGKIKAWVGGIIVVMMSLYLIKKVGRIVGAGKG